MEPIIGLFMTLGLVCITNAYYANPIPEPEPEPEIICPCQYRYDPVCGSDGVTYMNKCVLNCTAIYNLQRGLEPVYEAYQYECPGNCNCQKVDLPVCTLDGVTYPNECELSCENIKRIANKESIINLAYRTECVGPPGVCTDIAAPVCGSDNVLYRSKCVLDYASYGNEQRGLSPITVQNNGACQDGCLCPVTSQPICGCNGKYYTNACTLECENSKRRAQNRTVITEANQKMCEGCVCPAIYDPVCASDGNTYSSPCQLGCEMIKQQNPDLKPVYRGKCCKCSPANDPVCGSDLNTYRNLCWLQCENIGRERDLIDILYEGECQKVDCDCTYCDMAYQPMCGSDEQTYLNLCWLQCSDRCNQKNGRNPIFLSKRGSCIPTNSDLIRAK